MFRSESLYQYIENNVQHNANTYNSINIILSERDGLKLPGLRKLPELKSPELKLPELKLPELNC